MDSDALPGFVYISNCLMDTSAHRAPGYPRLKPNEKVPGPPTRWPISTNDLTVHGFQVNFMFNKKCTSSSFHLSIHPPMDAWVAPTFDYCG